MTIIKTEKEYRAHPAINFSSLSDLDTSPGLYLRNRSKKSKHDGDKIYFHIGSALDCLITDSEEEFNKQFVIGTVDAPSGMMLNFCDTYIHSKIDGLSDQDAQHQAYQKSGYRISKARVWEECNKGIGIQYINEKLEAYPATYLSREDGNLVKRMYESINSNPKVVYYFRDKNIKGIERKFQFPILFNACGAEAKALLDLLFIDHNEKKVYPIDLKTTGKRVEEFNKSFVSFKYYLQAAYYSEAVRQWMQTQTMIGVHDYSDYTIENFQFVVVSKKGYGIPLIFKTTDHDLHCGRHGGVVKGLDYKRGYEQLIDDLQWHKANNYWDTSRELFESSHTITLDIFEKNEV
jgi:hypothetical protein